MAAGIPGVGIGGLFYLINALLLPFRGLRRHRRGERVAWRQVFAQFAIAMGVLAGIGIAGWAIGFWIVPDRLDTASGSAFGSGAAAHTARTLGAASIFLSIGLLALVLVTVQLGRVFARRPR